MFVAPDCSKYVVSRLRSETIMDEQLREIYKAVEREVIATAEGGELFIRSIRRLRFAGRLTAVGGVPHLCRIVEETRSFPTVDIRVDKVLMTAQMLCWG